MKKIITLVICFLCFLSCLTLLSRSFYPNTTQNMSVIRTYTESYENGYIQNLSIVLSCDAVPDFETCAREIIEHCIQNDFTDIQFSYDVMGYPSQIYGTVYLNENQFRQNKELFRFSYQPSDSLDNSYTTHQHFEQYNLFIYEISKETLS